MRMVSFLGEGIMHIGSKMRQGTVGLKACRFRWSRLGLGLTAILVGSANFSFAQAPPEPVKAPAELAPMVPAGDPAVPVPPSRLFPGFGANQIRLPLLPGVPGALGTTPLASAETKAKVKKYLGNLVDPETTLDLVAGRTRILQFKEIPRRIQIADPAIAAYNVASPRELMLQGKTSGTTVLNLWFGAGDEPNQQEMISYLVRVLPDPEAKERLEKVYKALAEEVNKLFPASQIDLRLVGDKLVVTGRAHDVEQGTQILRIIRANAPGSGSGTTGTTAPANAADNPLNQLKLQVDPTQTGLPTPGLDSFVTAGGPNVINLLQVAGEQQVALRVTVAEINRSAARSIGMNFSLTNNAGVRIFSNITGNLNAGGNAGAGAGAAQGGANITATLDGGQLPLAIEALRTLNYAKSLAEPTLVTLNGQSANFQAGGQFPVPVVAGLGTGGGLQGVSFVPYGVQLSFTPFITDKDRIRLNINANVSTRDIASGANIGGAAISGLSTRNFSTTVELREGETLAVAGLIQNNSGADSTGIPGIGDIPVLNVLTGMKRIQAGEQELIVLIRPELVRPIPSGKDVPLPGCDLFEPGDVEFYLFGRIESHIPVNYRSPIRTDLGRIRQYYKLERHYMFGPTGYSAEIP
jgi:pilus assembly protein CpaC